MESSPSYSFCLNPYRLLLTAAVSLLLSPPWLAATASSSTLSSPPASLPRSRSSRRWSGTQNSYNYPPWNASPQIRHDGFLKSEFRRVPGEWEDEVRLRTRQRLDTTCRVRQVPGDGNCLFHSISMCLQHATNGTHTDLSRCLEDLHAHSQTLRQRAVACLRQQPRRRLFLQGRETLPSGELVQAAAQQYGLSSEEYCQAMEQDCVWGGGPEIVALSNLLRRPIHVYELAAAGAGDDDDSSSFVLRRMACFGSPRFDRREALHILSADSRFPDLRPGEQLAAGNHFLAVFPRRQPRRGSLRGGDDSEEKESSSSSPWLWSWWKRLLW